MASTFGLSSATKGMPGVSAPQQADYQAPGQQQLQQTIQQEQQQQPITLDNTQFNQTVGTQKSVLEQLQDISNGTMPTLAQQQLQQNLPQIAAMSQGSAQTARGVNPAQALRESNAAVVSSQQQLRAQTAQVSANQQLQAQQQAGQLQGQILQEQQNQQQMQLNVEQANNAFKQQIVGQEFSLASMQQTGNIAYNNAMTAYQTQQQQFYIQQQNAQQQQMFHYIAGGLAAAGAVVAAATGVGAPVAVGLGAIAAQQIVAGASSK